MIRSFDATDTPALQELWQECGFAMRPGDDEAGLTAFVERNPGMLLVEVRDGTICGSILAGWDGRRGWLYHVAVHPKLRRLGVGTKLVNEAERLLRERGCPKVNVLVWHENESARSFWQALGYDLQGTVELVKVLA